MDMMGRFAKDLRGFQNLAGLTSQNHCGRVIVKAVLCTESPFSEQRERIMRKGNPDRGVSGPDLLRDEPVKLINELMEKIKKENGLDQGVI